MSQRKIPGRTTHPAEWGIWRAMRARCNPSVKTTFGDNYHGRGITVCSEWDDSDAGFKTFLDDMGPRPSNTHSIERVDNNLGYSKDNCVWATKKRQARNRSSNRLITFGGETLTLAEWEARTGIHRCAISYRLDHGWSEEDTLTTPVLKHKVRIDGFELSVRQFAKKYCIPYTTATRKLKAGISPEDIAQQKRITKNDRPSKK